MVLRLRTLQTQSQTLSDQDTVRFVIVLPGFRHLWFKPTGVRIPDSSPLPGQNLLVLF